MSATYDKLPIIWKETHSKLSSNTVLQATILEMFENGMLEEVKPEVFFNGEIEQQFIDSCGLTSEQIMKAQRGETINIIELINKIYVECDLSRDEYKFRIKHSTDNLIEITINEISSNKFMLIEFSINESFLVNEVFISKNNLFYGSKHKKIFEIFTSEAYIDFRSEITI
jgi:hypothetical protein